MDAVLGAVEGWVAWDASFLREASTIVQFGGEGSLEVFEKMGGSWVCEVRKESTRDQNGLYL